MAKKWEKTLFAQNFVAPRETFLDPACGNALLLGRQLACCDLGGNPSLFGIPLVGHGVVVLMEKPRRTSPELLRFR
jgi:hypothetical protein